MTNDVDTELETIDFHALATVQGGQGRVGLIKRGAQAVKRAWSSPTGQKAREKVSTGASKLWQGAKDTVGSWLKWQGVEKVAGGGGEEQKQPQQ